MLVNDEGCVAEQTILRYQNNCVAELMNSDWYGILLLSPKGKVLVDTYYDVSGIDNEDVISFVSEHVTKEFFAEGESRIFDREDAHIFVNPIRKTEKDYYVFFVFYRVKSPFPERDVRWYKVYAQTATQRMLLENELAQEKSYLSGIMRIAGLPIAVIDPHYRVLSANEEAGRLYGDDLKDNGVIDNLSELERAIDAVLTNREDGQVRLILKNGRDGLVRLAPLINNKGAAVAVIVTGEGERFE